jgi:DNA polymerase III delta subunit
LFVVKKMAQRCRQMGLLPLKKMMITLADLDLSMKTGKIDPELAISLLMMRLSRQKK